MPGREDRPPLAAVLAVSVSVQTLTAMAMSIPSVIGPVAAADFGHPPARIGLIVGVEYVLAGLAGPMCGVLIARYGPARLLQVAVLAVAAGLMVASGTHVALAIAFAALAGTAHGVVNPVTSQIIAQAAPPGRRALIFSIKQTGVPIGIAIAGALLPSMLLVMSWQRALIVIGAASLALLFAVAPFRPYYDRQRNPRHPVVFGGLLAPVREVYADRRMLDIALASAAYSSVQVSMLTYLISFLNLELGFTLVAAGLVSSVATLGGVVGRILWGAIADRLRNPRAVLAFLGFAMSICGLATMQFGANWPLAAIVAVCAAYGATAVGWNGVFLAEVARLAPEGKAGLMTGGAQLFTFAGALAGPPVFGLITTSSGTYSMGFLLFAAVPLVTALRLAFAKPPRERAGAN